MFRITFFYILFAMFSTGLNILCQEISIRLYSGPYDIAVSIFVGTVSGLFFKYVLDKKYIFNYQPDNIKHDSQLFVIYTLMSVFTTLIFWGVEFSFHFVFQTKEMRYIGAMIGLAIGYTVKYMLDKKYVFIRE